MKTLFRIPRVILAAVAAMTGISQASILFQDGFDYPTGTLNGTQNGGTGFASGSNWGTNTDTIATGLRRLGFPSAGAGALKSGGYGIDYRALATPFGGSTFYMSMLINANNINTTRFGFELQNGGGPLFGRVNGGWGMFAGPNGKMGITNVNGNYQTWVAIPGSPDAADHLLIAKVDYQANAIKLWLDPIPGAAETTPTATLVTGGNWTINLNSQQWTGVRLMHENANQTADELRVGTTWADVNPKGPDLWMQEGFNYTPDVTVGDGTQNGGTGFTSTAWSTSTGGSTDFATIVGGLDYTRLASAGAGAINSIGWAGNSRAIDLPIGGRSFFLSMLVNANSTETGRLGFELQNGTTGPLFGRVNGGWGMFAGPSGQFGISNTAGNYQTWTGVTAAADSNTHLLVYKFDYDAQSISLWVDPVVNVNVGADPPTPSATLATGGNWTVNFTPATFWKTVRYFHQNSSQVADELRTGATWDSVVPFFIPNYTAWAQGYNLNPLTDGAPDADPDHDGYSNLEECQFSINPTVRGGVPGSLLLDTWNNVMGTRVIELTHSPRFTGPPDTSEFIDTAETPANRASNFGARMRGYVIAPTTGTYVFHVAGDDSAELWLSTSESQFARQKIAWCDSATDVHEWTKFASQTSAAVSLQAGQKYYIEALMKESTGTDHLEIAWTTPGSSITTVIPGSSLESYAFDANNISGDNLPDDWKTLHELNPAINGAAGDPDQDGISNYLEYLAGSDPRAANTVALKYERWNTLEYSSDLAVLKRNGIGVRPPDVTSIIANGSAPTSVADAYGARVSGYVTAPVTGDYTFYVTGDDHFELSLSSDDSPFNKTRIAWGDSWLPALQWNTYATQRSKTIHLVTGQRYYIEALLKECFGPDHLSIGWSYEAPVNLAPTAVGSGVTQSWSEDNGVVSLSVAGGDIWGTTDSFGFYKRPWSGNGEIIARVPTLNNPNAWAKVGIMLRATLDAGSLQASIVNTPANGFAFQRRTQAGSQSVSNNSFVAGAQWMRLVRNGETISASVTVDGIDWINMGSATFPGLPQNVYVGIAAANHSAGVSNPVIAIVQDFSVRTTEPTEVLPGGVLTPYEGNALDADSNGLPDAWEAQHPITGSAADKSQYGDPDGDLLTNLEEYQLGTDPTVADRAPGLLLFERWNNMPGYSVGELTTAPKFHGPADVVSLQDMTRMTFTGIYYGTRTRGYITPAVTGDYTFWVSGATSVDLWFSSDLTRGKYAKQRIAALGSDLGDGHGIVSTNPNLWDHFASQQSAPIHLVAGQSYYFEVLEKCGHEGAGNARVAWAHDGGDREMLPSSALSAYVKTAADSDDDFLPDAWETQNGLDPADNGAVDPARQGERGDFDSDGLTNRQEYLLGTNPANPDTYGYGISDGDLYRALGTSALDANLLAATYQSDVSLAGYTDSSVGWTQTSSGLIPNSFRGGATWSFSVPSDGFWLLRIDAALMGTTYDNEQVPVKVLVDGKLVFRKSVNFGSAKTGMFQALSPWLTAGNHQVTLFVDNMTARRTLSLLSIKVYAPANAAAILAQSNRLIPTIGTSLTSPAFVEGFARDITSATVNGNAVAVGTGNGHWYANVPLTNVGDAQSCAVQFEQGCETSGNFTWQATNVMDGQSLTIRKGDSLRLGAWGSNLELTSTITCSSGGTWNLTGNQTAAVAFNSAGSFTVSGTLQGGATATLSVKVVAMPDFATGLVDVAGNIPRTMTYSAATEVAFDTQDDLCHLIVSRTGSTGASVTMLPNHTQEYGLAARLGNDGPILGVQQVNVIGVSDALQNDLTSQSASGISGYKIYNAPLTVTNLPDGARVDVSIFRAGVMFLNGTTLKSIYPADLTNDCVTLQFLFPVGEPGGYCHTLLIYDRNGVYLGTK